MPRAPGPPDTRAPGPPGTGEGEVLQPGLVGAEPSLLERLHAQALHWEGEASRALEWLSYTAAALSEARAQRDDLVWGRTQPEEALGPALGALTARIEELERTEAIQAAHAAEAVPLAERAAAILAEAIAARDAGCGGEAG